MKMKDEWEIREDLRIPKNLEKAVKADFNRFLKSITGCKEFKGLSAKEKKDMMDWLPSVVMSGYMMSVVTSVLKEMMKNGKKRKKAKVSK